MKAKSFKGEMQQMRTSLSELLSNFRQGLPPERSLGATCLAGKIVSQHKLRQNEDIETWADGLSKDLSKLSDDF
jgi:hypothetical protein